MDEDNFDFLNWLSKEETGDVSKAARELINKGRLMLAIERYKKSRFRSAKQPNLRASTWAT
jgi:hypothetical protein